MVQYSEHNMTILRPGKCEHFFSIDNTTNKQKGHSDQVILHFSQKNSHVWLRQWLIKSYFQISSSLLIPVFRNNCSNWTAEWKKHFLLSFVVQQKAQHVLMILHYMNPSVLSALIGVLRAEQSCDNHYNWVILSTQLVPGYWCPGVMSSSIPGTILSSSHSPFVSPGWKLPILAREGLMLMLSLELPAIVIQNCPQFWRQLPVTTLGTSQTR